jgi:hypothetical protein
VMSGQRRSSSSWSIIAIIPVTRSSTYQKERDWLPVPYSVIGSPFSA